MKVTCFAASSSRASINKKLVTYAAGLIEDADINQELRDVLARLVQD